MRKAPQTKWVKTERRCFHWSTNTRPYQGRILRHSLQGDEKAAWDSFKFVVKEFLGNRRAQNYEELVSNLLQSYQLPAATCQKKYTSFARIWIFSQRTVVQWVMNMENVSINTFLQWRRDIKENETVLCSPTTVGLWQGIPLPWNASDR